jgi:selenocysteine lyase/cysteine desulfurase
MAIPKRRGNRARAARKSSADKAATDSAATDTALERWRADTPGCQERIHLNNAGAALPPRSVVDVMHRHLDREAEIGGYEAADEAVARIEEAYEALGRVVNARGRNIAIVENATVAIAQALSAFDFKPGDVLVTTRCDYPSNQLMYLSLAQRMGLVVKRAADLPSGGVDPASVRKLIRDPRCRLVVLTWVPTNSGLVQNAAAVGAVCEEAGIPFVIDACQAVGQLPVDVHAVRCDYLAGTARKFLRGPRGIGFLYVSDRALAGGAFPLYVDMRGADWETANEFRLARGARRFENWEFAYALVLGLGEAARYALAVGDIAFTRSKELAEDLREKLETLPQVRIFDRGTDRCAIVTIAVDGHEPEELKHRLRARGINTSVSDRMSGVIDFETKGITGALRLSPHYYNTAAELGAAVTVLDELTRS